MRSVDGIHDMGGLVGFGAIPKDEESFHHDWERRVFAMFLLARIANLDAGRHAIERLDPVTYLTAGYFGRWLASLELLLEEADSTIAPERGDALTGALRKLDRPPAFSVGASAIMASSESVSVACKAPAMACAISLWMSNRFSVVSSRS